MKNYFLGISKGAGRVGRKDSTRGQAAVSQWGGPLHIQSSGNNKIK
jgi:hypothetical protein